MPIGRSEIEDAFQELERQGFDAGVFTFTPTPYKNLGVEPAPLFAEMVVENTANSKQKTYEAGHGSSWPAEFSDDLRAGLFGPPAARHR